MIFWASHYKYLLLLLLLLVNLINDIYNEITQWHKNIFKLPSGKAAKSFITIEIRDFSYFYVITELTFWLEHFNKNSEYQYIALKVYFILPSLLLQKLSKKSKSKDHCRKLEERMNAWKEGRIRDLVREGRNIQQKITTSNQQSSEDKDKIFVKLMLQGKVNAALKLLSTDYDNGVHQINDDVINQLQQKHPIPRPIDDNILLHGPIDRILPSYFDSIDEGTISKAARLTKGAAGPSQLDADLYRHILTSTKYKKENKALREQIAILAREIASEIIDPNSLESYTSCRLIPLNKNPGVRPIGVGEVLRRIVGKSIAWVLKDDIQEAAGPLQTATGLQGGAEAAIHSMKIIFEQEDTEAVILIDASNAFNSLNRQVALHNVQVLCPNFSTVLINTYRIPSKMIVLSSKDILSTEGTTQGDNLAMSFCAIDTIPLLNTLQITSSNVNHVCLADDVTGAGSLKDLRNWWDTIISQGSKIGYYVNETKSWLIIKNELQLDEAKRIFNTTGIKFTTEGKRHLGATIGSADFRKTYATEKVQEWVKEVEKLSDYAKTQPQAAYAAFCHGEVHKYTYFMRTIPNMENYLKPLDE